MPLQRQGRRGAPRLGALQSAEAKQIVVALEDVHGPTDGEGRRQVIHRKNQRIRAFPVDAREMVATGRYGWDKQQGREGSGRLGLPAGTNAYVAAQATPGGEPVWPEESGPIDDDDDFDEAPAAVGGGVGEQIRRQSAGVPEGEEAGAARPKASTTATGEGGDDGAKRPAASEQDFKLTDVPGVGPEVAEKLEKAGFGTVAKLRAAKAEDLTSVPGVGTQYAKRIKLYVDEQYAPAKS